MGRKLHLYLLNEYLTLTPFLELNKIFYLHLWKYYDKPLYPDKQDTVQPLLGEDNAEPAFYYHGDHLGSASYVTASNGEVVGYHYYGARYYDSEKMNWLSVDPLSDKYPSMSPYAYCVNNPVILVDPDGRDGVIIIKGTQITIKADVYLYGEGATEATLTQMQNDVNAKWGGTYSATSADGTKFDVRVKINMSLCNNKEKSKPSEIRRNSSNLENFIEITSDDKRSFVINGNKGRWRSKGRNGRTLAKDDPAPHEVGHLLGLKDQYKENQPNPGWENNIMGAFGGKVEQRNIDSIINKDVMKAYNKWISNPENAGKEFRYEIKKGK